MPSKVDREFPHPYQLEDVFEVMPHIILTGSPDFFEVHKPFVAFRADWNGWILKIQHCLISENGKTLVFDCTAVRSGFSQDYYIRAETKDRGVTVRVDSYMRIERNEGVQRTIVAIASLIQERCTGTEFSKSNIPETILPVSGPLS